MPKGVKILWTEQDDNDLFTLSAEEMAKRKNCTVAGVMSRRYHVGQGTTMPVKVPQPERKNTEPVVWTPEMDAILKTKKTLCAAALALKVSKSSVHRRRQELLIQELNNLKLQATEKEVLLTENALQTFTKNNNPESTSSIVIINTYTGDVWPKLVADHLGGIYVDGTNPVVLMDDNTEIPVLPFAQPEHLEGKVVYGNIPYYLACAAVCVYVLQFEKTRDFSSKEAMKEAGMRLVKYTVKQE